MTDEPKEEVNDRIENIETYLKDLGKRLELPDGDKIVSVTFHKGIQVTDRLFHPNVYLLMVQGHNGNRYYLGINESEQRILTIQADGKIDLDRDGKDIYKPLIGEEGKQSQAQKDIFNFEKEKYIEQDKDGQVKPVDKEEQQNEVEQQKEEIKQADRENGETTMEGSDIVSIVSIAEPDQFAQALYKKDVAKDAEVYLVKYRNGQYKLWQKEEGKYAELMGIQISEFGKGIFEALNLDPTQTGKDTIEKEEFSLGDVEDKPMSEFAVVQKKRDINTRVFVKYEPTGRSTVSTLEYDGKERLKEWKTDCIYPDEVYIDGERTEIKPNIENREENSMLNDSRNLSILYKIQEIDREIEVLEYQETHQPEGEEEIIDNSEKIEELEERKRYWLRQVGLEEEEYNLGKKDIEARLEDEGHGERTRDIYNPYNPYM